MMTPLPQFEECQTRSCTRPSGMTCEHLQPLLESDRDSGLLRQVANLLARGHVPPTACKFSDWPGHSNEQGRWRCQTDCGQRCSPKTGPSDNCETVRVVRREGEAFDLVSRNAMMRGLMGTEGGDQVLPFVRLSYEPSTFFWEDTTGGVHHILEKAGNKEIQRCPW